MNKLFPGACWQLGFLTGASWREKAGKSDPQAAACEVCNQTPSKEGLGDKDFFLPLCAGPCGTASASSQGPFNTCIFAALGWDLCSRAPLAVRAGCWGSGAWPQHFCHRESRAQPAWRGLSRGGQRLSRFPTIFNVNIFFLAPYLRVPQLVFGFLLEGIAAYVAVYGVHTGDGKVSTFLRCLLGSASHQCSFSEL